MSRRYEVAWSPTAQRDLTKLPEKVATAVIELVYGALADDPHRVGVALRLGLEGFHSARRGGYRVVYAIDDESRRITVVTVGHRSDVHRQERR